MRPAKCELLDSNLHLASWKMKAYQTGIYRGGDDRSVQEATKIYRILINALPESDPSFNEKKAD